MRELTTEEVKAVSGGISHIRPPLPSIPLPIPGIPGDPLPYPFHGASCLN